MTAENGHQTITTKALDAMVKKYVDARDRVSEQKKICSELEDEKYKLELQLLDALKLVDKKSYRVDGLGLISRSEKYAVRVPATIEAKKEFFGFLQKRGEDVFLGTATVNYQTLNSFYNAEMEAAEGRNEALTIPGIEAPTLTESIAFRKEK